jgi:ubiquinone/menaquinone biosynthesis C-methylase UbiE
VSDSQPPICDYEGSDYQASFWDLGGRIYEDKAEAIALQRLLPQCGKLMLELGAGAGRNTLRYTGFERVVLLDYSLTQLQQASSRLGRGRRYVYVAADIYKLPFVNGLFDASTMIRTLHHMAEPKFALEQIHRTMQPGAIFILEYANKHNLKAMVRYHLRKQSWSPYTLESIEFEKLNYDFHPKAVRSWLNEVGFKLEDQLSVSYFRIGALKRLLPIRLLTLFDQWLQPTGRWFQLSPSVFTRSRAEGNLDIASQDAFFKCLECGSNNLVEQGSAITCLSCSREWPIRDGVYDFRIPSS